MAKKQLITKTMLIGDLVKEYPESVGIMLDHGMQCIGCHIATWETLEQGAESHAINLNELLRDLNKMTGGKKK